jgi:hypothetical protein
VLEQNVPNPFNPANVDSFLSAGADRRASRLYDVARRARAALGDGVYDTARTRWSGTARIANGHGVASGFYVYRLVTDGHAALTKKMMLLK